MNLEPSYTLQEDLIILKTHLPHIDTLFSNLRILQIGPGISTDSLPLIPFLLGPKLERCELKGSLNRKAMSTILLHLAQCAPGLKDLEIDNARLKNCAGVLCSFHKLESFRCRRGELTKADLFHLAQLPSLWLAEVSLGAFEIPPADELEGVFFPSLRYLWIHSDHSPSSILRLLESIQSLTLDSLTVHFPAPSSGHFNSILEAIAKFKDLHLLMIQGLWNSEWAGGQLELYTIEPLLGLRDLVDFSIEAPGIACSEDAIPRFAEAWPYMSGLTLIRRPGALLLPHSTFTLNALKLFSKHMPKLDALQVDMDMASVPKPLSAADRNMHDIELSLEKNPLKAKAWAKVAAFISSVYPNASMPIDEVYPEDGLPENCRHWRKVQAAVKAYGRLLNDNPAESGSDSDLATDSDEESEEEGSDAAEEWDGTTECTPHS